MDGEGRYYFVSDVHLGAADDPEGIREKAFISFLDSIPKETRAIFFLGDIFDFWVDYKRVVPRGHTRVLGRFALLADRGVKLHFFKGNHDWWMTDYFSREFGAVVVDEPFLVVPLEGKNFCIGHGDSLNCSDSKARLIFHLFRNRFLIRLMKSLPSSWVFSLAGKWAGHSRKQHSGYNFDIDGSDILKFAEEMSLSRPIDYFIFGHFHTPSRTLLKGGGELVVLGDWSRGANYLYFSGMKISGLGLPNIQR